MRQTQSNQPKRVWGQSNSDDKRIFITVPEDDRQAVSLAHMAPLLGLFLPLIGHVGGPALVKFNLAHRHPSINRHINPLYYYQFRWGCASLITYASVPFIGLPGIIFALAVTIPWAINAVVSAKRVEEGCALRGWLVY